MLIYIATFATVFAFLVFLKFCEGSPVRSWKMVVLVGLPLALLLGYYLEHAFPKKAVPLPQSAKASAYQLELERTFRRIAGVDHATFEGHTVKMNFTEDKPLAEFKNIALSTGSTAAYCLRTNENVKVTVHITVQNRDRYELTFDSGHGLTDEHEY